MKKHVERINVAEMIMFRWMIGKKQNNMMNEDIRDNLEVGQLKIK